MTAWTTSGYAPLTEPKLKDAGRLAGQWQTSQPGPQPRKHPFKTLTGSRGSS